MKNMIPFEHIKVRVIPSVMSLFDNIINDEYKISIARGLWYQETIKEQKITETTQEVTVQNEQGENITEMRNVQNIEYVDVPNPETPEHFIADKFVDILLETSFNAIRIDNEVNVLPYKIAQDISKIQ